VVDQVEVQELEKASRIEDAELREELHHHLEQQARDYGITEKTISTNSGWNIRLWRGWEVLAETPERVYEIIAFVFTSLNVPDAKGKCWSRTIGATGVRGLRENWATLLAHYAVDHSESDVAERTRDAGWWAG